MQRFALFFLTGIVFFGLLAAASAFTPTTSKKQTVSVPKNAKKQTVYEHFQFNGGTYNEINFENDANWSAIGTTNPSSNPCTDGTSKTCVLRIDQSLLSTDPDLSLPEKLALYLQNESGMTGATDFVNANYTYRKP